MLSLYLVCMWTLTQGYSNSTTLHFRGKLHICFILYFVPYNYMYIHYFWSIKKLSQNKIECRSSCILIISFLETFSRSLFGFLQNLLYCSNFCFWEHYFLVSNIGNRTFQAVCPDEPISRIFSKLHPSLALSMAFFYKDLK